MSILLDERLSRAFFYTLLLSAGIANGFAATVILAIRELRWEAVPTLFGIGIVGLGMAGGTLMRLVEAGRDLEGLESVSWLDILAGALVLSAALFPSSAASWVAMALVALMLRRLDRSEAFRAALMLVLLLSIHELWFRLVFRQISQPFTVLDALSVEHLLSLVLDGVSRTGNIITTPFNRLLIRDTCSSCLNMGAAMVATAAVRSWFVAPMLRGAIPVYLRAALFILLINLIRLAAMAVSPPIHAALHTPIGLASYDAFCLMTVVLLAVPRTSCSPASLPQRS
jgi:hypothetical protein